MSFQCIFTFWVFITHGGRPRPKVTVCSKSWEAKKAAGTRVLCSLGYSCLRKAMLTSTVSYQAASALAVRWCMDINLFALKGCKRAALVLRCNHQLILSLFSFHWWICSSVCSLLCPLWTTITIHLNSWKGGISKTTFVWKLVILFSENRN